jgi:high affinity cGMP-specific 3',5'-cyclic phosphodiesterase 9
MVLYKEVLLCGSVIDQIVDLDEKERRDLTALEYNVFPIKESNREDLLFALLLTMFKELELIETFRIPSASLYRFLLMLSRRYRDVPFHNFYHAFNVTQTLYHLMIKNNVHKVLEPIEVLALLIAALCHDCDHPGLNNDFQKKAQTHIARLYNNTSVLENHHCMQASYLLSRPECNILVNLTPEDEEQVRQLITMCILATDLALHGMILQRLRTRGAQISKMIDEGEELDKEDRELIMCMMVKCADISNEIRPKNIAKKWAHLVIEEFFAQSDLEKTKGLPVAAFMDKTKIIIPQEQINFISKLCMPLYEAATVIFPNMRDCCRQMTENQESWQHVMDTFFSEQGTSAYSNRSIWEREQVGGRDSLAATLAGRFRGFVSTRGTVKTRQLKEMPG